MNELTYVLITIGLIVVAIIAVSSIIMNRKNQNLNDFSHSHEAGDDVLLSKNRADSDKFRSLKSADMDLPHGFSTSEEEERTVRDVSTLKFAPENLPEDMEPLIISMVIQRDNYHFSGYDIVDACEKNGLEYGLMDIFHCPIDDKSGHILFSLASMVEPGTFPIEEMESFISPGLSVFIQLPLPMNNVDAFNQFIDKIQKLAKTLQADIYDKEFNRLTAQSISHNIEIINSYQYELLKAKKISGS